MNYRKLQRSIISKYWSVDEALLNAAEIIAESDVYIDPTEFDYNEYDEY
ncbi:hypothetical protein NVP1049O_57 [Vibrio phage 1.049.O._10N.286.54.B5]|nr:hypothetical protein NVP1049O_57 [Vibrio phage 1.049.O._10N.286.54.B5]AUR84226.1 hypothetical protein NVP1050O_57 [Vibrio phage 1.050.O._10N.286.48.A6]